MIQQKQPIPLNKDRLNGLYGKLLLRLYEVKQNTKGIKINGFIPYSYIYLKVGRNFSLKKQEVKELLFFLSDMGFLEINQKGIKCLFKIKCD
ncbi:MAG: hypothetical protein ABFQ65_00070 [Nanoarchaeota archaeon]